MRHYPMSPEQEARVRRARLAKYAATDGAARAAARSGRSCEGCGEPLKAARATKRFCSVRCRVAAHRAGA
jgi:hypothetical protein